MKAIISDIKRFAVHDGDGIRTTVFFKGCSLNCIWCHNPESIGFQPTVAYFENKCINCGECLKACKKNAHFFADDKHLFLRQNCSNCGKCESVCLGEALKYYGKEYSVEKLLMILLEDKNFYISSGGGVTLSGGECLCQADFCAELLKQLKLNRINTAIDTCGFVPQESIDRVIPYTDTFLYDIKAIDEDVHVKCTGHSNKLILENLKYINSKNKNIEVRIPYVPNFNDDQIEKITEFLMPLGNIIKVRILPYHNYAGSKYDALNIKNTLPEKLPTEEQIKIAETVIYNNMKLNI